MAVTLTGPRGWHRLVVPAPLPGSHPAPLPPTQRNHALTCIYIYCFKGRVVRPLSSCWLGPTRTGPAVLPLPTTSPSRLTHTPPRPLKHTPTCPPPRSSAARCCPSRRAAAPRTATTAPSRRTGPRTRGSRRRWGGGGGGEGGGGRGGGGGGGGGVWRCVRCSKLQSVCMWMWVPLMTPSGSWTLRECTGRGLEGLLARSGGSADQVHVQCTV